MNIRRLTDQVVHDLLVSHDRGYRSIKRLVFSQCLALTGASIDSIVRYGHRLEVLDLSNGCGALVDPTSLFRLLKSLDKNKNQVGLLLRLKEFNLSSAHYLTKNALRVFFTLWTGTRTVNDLVLRKLVLSGLHALTPDLLDCLFPKQRERGPEGGDACALMIDLRNCENLMKSHVDRLRDRLNTGGRQVFVEENCALVDGSFEDIRRYVQHVSTATLAVQ